MMLEWTSVVVVTVNPVQNDHEFQSRHVLLSFCCRCWPAKFDVPFAARILDSFHNGWLDVEVIGISLPIGNGSTFGGGAAFAVQGQTSCRQGLNAILPPTFGIAHATSNSNTNNTNNTRNNNGVFLTTETIHSTIRLYIIKTRLFATYSITATDASIPTTSITRSKTRHNHQIQANNTIHHYY
jgi:hypothetical protein